MTTTNKILGGIVVLIMTATLLIASSCDAPPPEATAHDYAPLIVQAADTTAARLNTADKAARAQETALRKTYKQKDFDVMRGVVLEPVEK